MVKHIIVDGSFLKRPRGIYAAMDAIKKTKFTPGIKDNKPVKAEVIIPVMFKLS